MPKYRYPSELELNDNLYLIDTCVWIDIAKQLSLLFRYENRRKATGISNPSVEAILNRIFKKSVKIYVTKDIKNEYIGVFNKNKDGHLNSISSEIRNTVFDYMKSLEEDDAYLISSNSDLLTRDLKNKRDKYKGDRRIFVSGRSRYIGNIVTQDWDDYRAVRKDLFDKYNPIIYKCTIKNGIFNGLELKGGKLTQPRKIKEYFKPLARKFLEYLEKLFN